MGPEPSSSGISPCSRRHLLRMLTYTMAGTAVLSRLALAEDAVNPVDGPKPLLLESGKGKTGSFGGVKIDFKLAAAQTWGNLGSAELILAPGFLGAPPHFQKHFDEVVRVLEGTVTVMVRDTTYDVPAGGWHLRPRGVVHTFWNSGNIPAKSIELYLPGGHEEYMQELATLFEDGKKPSQEVLAALGEKNDVHFAFDKLPGIMDKYKVKL
jgi:mannose-6-phosphate isomerase-like protein (cupin superfamily)